MNSHFGVGEQFGTSSWIQEVSVTSNGVAHNVPYPELSETAFSRIEVNGSTPRLDLQDGLVMDLFGGPILVPTREVSGAASACSG